MLLAALMLLAACGSGAASTGGQPTGSTRVSMAEFAFQPSSLEVKSGKTVLYLVNVGKVSHDLAVLDASGQRVAKSDLVQAGDSSTFTIDNLLPGVYKIFCDQPGHEAGGMRGTLKAT